MTGAILAELQAILAQVTGREEIVAPDAALFGPEVSLDSLTGTLLLAEVRHRFGVDVAAEDLSLDSLATLATLAAFISERRPAPPPGEQRTAPSGDNSKSSPSAGDNSKAARPPAPARPLAGDNSNRRPGVD